MLQVGALGNRGTLKHWPSFSSPIRESVKSAGMMPATSLPTAKARFTRVLVQVRDNNVDQALKALKKKLQREGVFREMKLRNHFEKPSEKRVREQAEAVRRARKLARKKAQREGIMPNGQRGKAKDLKAPGRGGPGRGGPGGGTGGGGRGGAGGAGGAGGGGFGSEGNGFGGGGFGGAR